MKQLCVLLLLFAVGFTAVAGTDCWTYTPPASGTRGSITWTDSSGFENVIKGVVLSGDQIRIIPGENKNSTTLRNADFSVPVRDEGGSELAYSPDFLAGKDNTGQSILAYIDGLTNVVMNANATSIGNYALKSNPNLVRVRLNDGLQSIGTQAFHQDTALAVIENFLPDSVKTLGKEAFRECKALVGPVVARGLETVGDRVFHTDLVLVGADLGGSTIETFPEYVFFTCPKLGSVVLPESTRVIGNGCFEACSSLTNVTPLLPPRLETLGSDSNPTWRDDPIGGHVVSPPSLARIGTRAFRTSKIETFTAAKKGLKSIGQYAFYQNYSLTNVVLSADMDSITGEWLSESGKSGIPQHVWFRNLPATLPSSLWKGTKDHNITIHLPWSQRDAWREWVASGPADHVFTFGDKTKTLPARRNDVGTWKAGVTQNVTWWKDSDLHFTITVR